VSPSERRGARARPAHVPRADGDPHAEADAAPSPYTQLLALAERQAALAREGHSEHISSLHERFEVIRADAPATPPAAMASLLARAAVVQERAAAQLTRLQEQLRREIATVTKARAAVRSRSRMASDPQRVDRRV